MNKIYWGKDEIVMLTDHLNAVSHRHLMLQLFLGLEDDVKIHIRGRSVTESCVITGNDVSHSFFANKKPHLSVLFEPVSAAALQIEAKMNDCDYLAFSRAETKDIRKTARELSEQFSPQLYERLIGEIYKLLGITQSETTFDERVSELLRNIEKCDCCDHSISHFASQVCLSDSRLSHLFKEQTGMTLKGYISLHRMKRAFSLLLSGESITNAAMKAGFDSPSHFAATVKKMMGMPARLSLKDSEFLKV